MKDHKKGLKSYNYKADVLYVRPAERSFEFSEVIGDFILDFDKENNLVGIEILDASRAFRCPKQAILHLKNLEIEITVKERTILIQAKLTATVRNSLRDTVLDVERIKPDYIEGSSSLALEMSS